MNWVGVYVLVSIFAGDTGPTISVQALDPLEDCERRAAIFNEMPKEKFNEQGRIIVYQKAHCGLLEEYDLKDGLRRLNR